MDQSETHPRAAMRPADLGFAVTTCIVVVMAHAVAYMTHEYAHAFVAWALGCVDV